VRDSKFVILADLDAELSLHFIELLLQEINLLVDLSRLYFALSELLFQQHNIFTLLIDHDSQPRQLCLLLIDSFLSVLFVSLNLLCHQP